MKMNLIKRVFAVAVVAAASVFSASAADPTGVKIEFQDEDENSTLQLLFTSNPEIKMTTDGVQVTSDKLDKTLTYEFTDVKKVSFVEVTNETTSGITKNEVAKKPNVVFAYSNGVIKVSGLSANELVRVVAINGTVFKSAKASNEGTLDIDIDNAQAGVYVVTTNSVNFKLIKK